jgi:TnpA family transposase
MDFRFFSTFNFEPAARRISNRQYDFSLWNALIPVMEAFARFEAISVKISKQQDELLKDNSSSSRSFQSVLLPHNLLFLFVFCNFANATKRKSNNRFHHYQG